MLETLLVLPAGVFLVRCGSSNPHPPVPGANPTVSGSQGIFTSSVAQNHSHTFAIPLTDFVNLPSGGLSGDTSNNANHTHHVSISMDEFLALSTGSSVAVTTSNVANHTHVFTFVMLTAADGGLLKPVDAGMVKPADAGTLVKP